MTFVPEKKRKSGREGLETLSFYHNKLLYGNERYIWIRVQYIYVCKWFEYEVIKKMTMQIMTNWSKIFIWSTLFENRIIGQRGWKVSYFTWRNGLVGILCPKNDSHNITI